MYTRGADDTYYISFQGELRKSREAEKSLTLQLQKMKQSAEDAIQENKKLKLFEDEAPTKPWPMIKFGSYLFGRPFILPFFKYFLTAKIIILLDYNYTISFPEI